MARKTGQTLDSVAGGSDCLAVGFPSLLPPAKPTQNVRESDMVEVKPVKLSGGSELV